MVMTMIHVYASRVPAMPMNLMLSDAKIFQLNSVTVTLQWDPSPTGTKYFIMFADSVSDISSTSYQLSNVAYNIPHTVTVTASNCVGNSTASVFMFQIGHCDEVEVENVVFSGFTDGREGSVISYTCRSGTVPTSGERTRTSTCTNDGTWNPDPRNLNCVVDCGPPMPARGVVLQPSPVTDTTEGSTIMFHCDGLVPNTTFTATCSSTGMWSPDPANHGCTEDGVDCGAPSPPLNGSIDPYTSTVVGSVVTIRCHGDLVPRGGEMSFVCGSDGNWSPNPADIVCESAMPTTGRVGAGLSGGEIGGIAAAVVTFGLLLFFIGFASVYIFIRRKQSPGKTDESGSTISQDPKPPPVYEVIATSPSSQEEIELQANLAYGPIKQKH